MAANPPGPKEILKKSVTAPAPPPINIPTTDKSEITEVPLWKQVANLIRQIRTQGLRITLIEACDQFARVTTGAPTRHFTQIAPDVFVGGQHIKRGLPILGRRGVTAIVNMRHESDDHAKGRTLAAGRYLYLPTMDNTPPTLEHLEEGASFIGKAVADGGKVYIHCWEGVGRAPTMGAAYLVSAGMTPDEAWAHLRRVRPFIRPTIAQEAQVKRFAQRLDENGATADGRGQAALPAVETASRHRDAQG